MKKLIIPIILYFFINQGLHLNAQSLEEILASHAKAMGYEKLAEVKTINILGESYFEERTVPYKTIIKRPDKYYHERDFMGRKQLRVYDGETAWSLDPMNGLNQVYGNQLKMLKKNMDFGGMLYKWQEKGLKVSLDGKEEFEEREVFKLKVEDEEGEVSEIYLDVESFLTLKQETQRKFQENVITAIILYSEYQMIEGIAVACKTETRSDGMSGDRGMGGGISVIKSIEFNQEVEDTVFTKPETKR